MIISGKKRILMVIEPNDLRVAAEEFRGAELQLGEIVKKLDDVTTDLKGKWEGAAQQVFYKEYETLRGYMEVFGKVINEISMEMHGLADRFEAADQ